LTVPTFNVLADNGVAKATNTTHALP
jgi:hypothetical protein